MQARVCLWYPVVSVVSVVPVVAVVAFEGCGPQHCELQRKDSDSLGDSWGGECFCQPCFGLLL